MTQESIHERKEETMLTKHAEHNIYVKGKHDNGGKRHNGKRFRRKPMKCVSIHRLDRRKHIDQHLSKGDIDPNNNELSYDEPRIHTEVIDIEEERVKDKTNSIKEKTGIKRKKTSLDQLLSKVVANKYKLEENRVKSETEKHVIRQTIDRETKETIYVKPPSIKHRHNPKSAFSPVISSRHRPPTSNLHHEQHSPEYSLPRRHFTTTVISPPPPPPPPPQRVPPTAPLLIQTTPEEQDEEESYYHTKLNKRTENTNQRYSQLSNTQLQRRLVANARERSRVHALSNAFDALRCTIPSYSTEQKLSKLTILRVAINYIDALTQLLAPKTPDTQERFERCVDECSAVLQTEYGRSKMK